MTFKEARTEVEAIVRKYGSTQNYTIGYELSFDFPTAREVVKVSIIYFAHDGSCQIAKGSSWKEAISNLIFDAKMIFDGLHFKASDNEAPDEPEGVSPEQVRSEAKINKVLFNESVAFVDRALAAIDGKPVLNDPEPSPTEDTVKAGSPEIDRPDEAGVPEIQDCANCDGQVGRRFQDHVCSICNQDNGVRSQWKPIQTVS